MSLLLKEPFTSTGMAASWTSLSGGTITSSGRNAYALVADSGTHMVYQVASTDEDATFIVGVAVKASAYTDDTDPDDFGIISFCSDSGATCHVYVGFSANAIRVYRGQRGTVLATSATALTTGAWNYVEVKVTLSDTVGVVQVHQDGVQTINLSGADTKNAGTKTVLDTVKFGGFWPTNSTLDDIYIFNAAGSTFNDFNGDPGDVSTLASTSRSAAGSLTLSGSVGAVARATAAGSLALGGTVVRPVTANGSLTLGAVSDVKPVYLATFTIDAGMELSDIPLLPADVPTVDYAGDDDSDLVSYTDPTLDEWGRPIAS